MFHYLRMSSRVAQIYTYKCIYIWTEKSRELATAFLSFPLFLVKAQGYHTATQFHSLRAFDRTDALAQYSPYIVFILMLRW